MVTSPSRQAPLIILENGDRLTRSEFERRYAQMSDLKKAELIEGVVYMASPVRVKKHGHPHSHIITWLGTYEAATSGVMVCDNATVRIDDEYVLQQPDEAGMLQSDCFPGLQLAVSALLSGNMAEVLATQQRALTSEMHQAFVTHLQPQN